MLHVIAYDIQDDKRRNRAAKVLKSYGYRMQESVFECAISEDKLKQLMVQLAAVLAPEDQVSIYQVCAQCRQKIKRWGPTANRPQTRDFIVID